MMDEPHDNILIVDDDPDARAFLREQVFPAEEFAVFEADDGADALLAVQEHHPDLIVLDLQLGGLGGSDLLVAVRSIGYTGALIVITDGGTERSAVNAFRLGATDYVVRPVRETELLAAVERGLEQARLRRDRGALVEQLQALNRQLEATLGQRETIYTIGRSVAAMRDLGSVFDRVLAGALALVGADYALLLLRDDKSNRLILRAGQHLPLALLDRLGQPVDDPIADLVMTSREALALAGEGLQRFKVPRDLHAVVYAPLTVQSTAIGVLAAGNAQTETAFSGDHARTLTTLADYATIAIVNTRLYNMLETRAHAMENAYRELRAHDAERQRRLNEVLEYIEQPLIDVQRGLRQVADGGDGAVTESVAQRLRALEAQLQTLCGLIDRLPRQSPATPRPDRLREG